MRCHNCTFGTTREGLEVLLVRCKACQHLFRAMRSSLQTATNRIARVA